MDDLGGRPKGSTVAEAVGVWVVELVLRFFVGLRDPVFTSTSSLSEISSKVIIGVIWELLVVFWLPATRESSLEYASLRLNVAPRESSLEEASLVW